MVFIKLVLFTKIICFFKSDFFIGVIASLLASIVYVFVIDKTIIAVRKCFVNKKLKKIIGFNLSNKNKFFLILPSFPLILSLIVFRGCPLLCLAGGILAIELSKKVVI